MIRLGHAVYLRAVKVDQQRQFVLTEVASGEFEIMEKQNFEKFIKGNRLSNFQFSALAHVALLALFSVMVFSAIRFRKDF